MAPHVHELYYSGQYKSASEVALRKSNAPYIIGALCFRGQHERARSVFKKYGDSFGRAQMVFVRFHLGLSYTRTSDYKRAEGLFVENWKQRHLKGLKAGERFLIYQGLSFFRFFFSKHQSSLAFASKAKEQLLYDKAAPPLFITLVNDLCAHNYYQLGRPAKGELLLKKAIKTARENDLSDLKEELEASLAIYQSEFDLNVHKNIKYLKKQLKKTVESNDYTSSELVLQISKLFLLNGDFKKANDFLIQNFNIIYKNDNKRKVAKLNTLLAQLLIPKQQYIEALSLLKVAKSNLDEEIDLNLLAPILGLEEEILTLIGQDSSEQESKLEKIIQRTDKAIINQISKRRRGAALELNEEDPLGVLFDKVQRGDISCIEQIIEKELFYLIKKLCGPIRSKRVICLHPKNKGIFLLDEEKVFFSESRLSKNQIRFLNILEGNPLSKEEIVKKIWGYREYDPFRHDHLVYSMVKRVRKVLGSRDYWIQSTGEDRYEIDSEVHIIFNLKQNDNVGAKLQTAPGPDRSQKHLELSEDLNFRQVQLVEGLFDYPFSAGEVATYFKTTRMTSYRDLDDLVKKGYLQKRGKGRGTRYHYN